MDQMESPRSLGIYAELPLCHTDSMTTADIRARLVGPRDKLTNKHIEDLSSTFLFFALHEMDPSFLSNAVSIALGHTNTSQLNSHLINELREMWLDGAISASQLVSTLYLLVKNPESEKELIEILNDSRWNAKRS